MRKRMWKRTIAMIMVVAMGASLVGCASKSPKEENATNKTDVENEKGGNEGELITITVPSANVGNSPQAQLWKEIIADFETLYEGKIAVQSEEIPGLETFTNKLRTLAMADEMPDVILQVGGSLLEDFQKAGLLADLTPYLEADSELKAQYTQESLDFNTIDGKVYALPREQFLMGYFYNTELFEKAGISEPAKTWPEFWDNCDKLLAAGITPFSMDTIEAGWITSLMLGALIGTGSEEGQAFMNEYQPKDFERPEVVKAVATIQNAYQKYTTSDAVGAGYSLAANHFLQGETAMIFNGTWMASEMQDPEMAAEGLFDKIEVTVFPNNGVYFSPTYGDMIGSKDKAHADAAVEFLKYYHSAEVQRKILMGAGSIPDNPQVVIDDEVIKAQRLTANLYEQALDAEYKFSDYGTMWTQPVQDTLTTAYPLLATGEMTPEEFCQKLTEVANKSN